MAKKPAVLWWGTGGATGLSGQMARHRAALQTAEALKERRETAAARAVEAQRVADERASGGPAK